MINIGYFKYRLLDLWSLRFSLHFSNILFLFSKVLFCFKKKKYSVKILLMSIRFGYPPGAQEFLVKHFSDYDFFKIISKPTSKEDAEGRAIMLSAPHIDDGNFYKGVILITFSHTFSYFLRHRNWPQLNRNFAFILEPSWAGYADPDILAFAQRAEHCVIQASEIKDRILMNSIFPGVPCMDTGASNWIDDMYFDRGKFNNSNKEFDAVYVANLNPIKRVFRAIDLAWEVSKFNKNVKIAIVCAGWGSGSFEDLSDHIKKRKLHDNLFLYKGMPQERLMNLVNKSKCSILLSFKEGSNRVLFESMFLDVPVICLSENVGVNKSYINAETGLLVSDSLLPKALVYMSSNYKKFSPRNWAINNISPKVTTEKISRVINNNFPKEVNSNLLVKVNSPEVSYRDNMLDKSLFLELMGANSDSEFLNKCREMNNLSRSPSGFR